MELFAFKNMEQDKSDVPRGSPPPVTRTYDLYEEKYSNFGCEEVPKGLFREFGVGVSKKGVQWHRCLGWKGVQKGWYQNSQDWPPYESLPQTSPSNRPIFRCGVGRDTITDDSRPVWLRCPPW